MSFSVPKNALIVIADGHHALYFRNGGDGGIKLQKDGELAHNKDGRGAAPLPAETSPHEKGEATFARHIATDLHAKVGQGGISAIVLIADPQTLGQLRPSLHQDVAKRITGELHKTLVKSSIADIERTLNAACA